MDLLSGNIGGIDFPQMVRGNFYKFSYVNSNSKMQDAMMLNPIIVFSALDRNRRIQGLDLRVLRASEAFLEDYTNFYFKDGKMDVMFTPEHPYAFSHRILKALFKRNPDVESAWRIYNPLYMKNIKGINIDETKEELKEFNKVRVKNMGIL
jgi:hypothetical protein